MVSVGTMIGAGYASGQEIVAYFGTAPSALVPVVCGVLMLLLTLVLLGVGSRTTGELGEVNRVLLGRASPIADAVMIINAVIVLSAMMAGTDSACRDIFGIELPYGVLLALAGTYVVRRGGGLERANAVMVPCIAVTLAAVCLSAGFDLTSAFALSELPAGFAYVSMNLLLGAGVLVTRRGMTARERLAAGVISSLVIAALLALICGALPFAPAGELPLLALASHSRVLYALYAVCLLCSVFTTMIGAFGVVGSAFVKSGKGGEAMLAAAFLGACVSVFGFGRLVGALYPLIGVLGAVYVVRCAAFLLFARIKFFRKRDSAVHERGKCAERDRCRHNEIGFEHLPAVYDKIPEPRAGDEVFAHDRAHPAQSDVDFKHGQEGGDGGGQYGVAQKLHAVRTHGAEQQQFIRGGGA